MSLVPIQPFGKAKALTHSTTSSLHSHSTQLMTQVGIAENQIPKELVSLMDKIRGQISAQAIQKDLQLLAQGQDKILQPLEKLIEQIMARVGSEGFSAKDIEKANTLIAIARTTMQVYQESFQQNLVLQAHGRKIFTDDANKLVSFLMDARMAEMKLLEEGLSTCYKQENFALEMFLKQRAMSMQKEVQTFNQILRLQELDHQSKMQRLDHKQEMELLQQSHDDKMAFIEKEQSEMRAAHAAKMNGLESEARQQIANLLTQTQEVGGK